MEVQPAEGAQGAPTAGAQPVLVLDGGMGHLLKTKGVLTSVAGHPKWGDSFLVPALANVEAPGAVRQARPLLTTLLGRILHGTIRAC